METQAQNQNFYRCMGYSWFSSVDSLLEVL